MSGHHEKITFQNKLLFDKAINDLKKEIVFLGGVIINEGKVKR